MQGHKLAYTASQIPYTTEWISIFCEFVLYHTKTWVSIFGDITWCTPRYEFVDSTTSVSAYHDMS